MQKMTEKGYIYQAGGVNAAPSWKPGDGIASLAIVEEDGAKYLECTDIHGDVFRIGEVGGGGGGSSDNALGTRYDYTKLTSTLGSYYMYWDAAIPEGTLQDGHIYQVIFANTQSGVTTSGIGTLYRRDGNNLILFGAFGASSSKTSQPYQALATSTQIRVMYIETGSQTLTEGFVYVKDLGVA